VSRDVAEPAIAPRLRALPRRRVLGIEVAVALGPRARLLGLAHLSRERAGAGLLIPGCACVHTFGMRFALDLVFLDAAGEVLAVHRAVGPRRLRWRRGADAVLEVPTGAWSSPGRCAGEDCGAGSSP
jgi:uncharacterized membrane protein (UPF0127 family)